MRVVAFSALVALSSVSARAQTIETPIPFDSAQRVLTVTPGMAERLALRAPVWPVTGTYNEARLYSIVPGTGFTLVVHRPSGALERFSLSPSERTALGAAIDSAMKTAGRPSSEAAASNVVSEPAGNAFARRLTVQSALVYGPLAASLSDDGQGAGALYLLTTGLTYFISYSAAQSTPFTRAQSDLAGNLGLATASGALLTGYAISENADRGVRALALVGAVAGTIAGVNAGKGMSDAEAHSGIMGIETGAAVGVTAAAASNEGRAMAIGAVVGGALGYPLGVLYPRRAGYTVTAGDAESIGTTALIGAAWAGATLTDHVSPARIGLTLGAGYVAGAFVGERWLSRPFNLTQNQANVLKVGAVAGGLVGLALPVLSGSDDVPVVLGAVAGGATLGVAALAGSFPLTSRAGSAAADGSSRGGLRLSFSPASLFGIAKRSVGQHSLVRLTF
ncbi:MAG: hypothetical protein ACREBE_11640 [bacterium]